MDAMIKVCRHSLCCHGNRSFHPNYRGYCGYYCNISNQHGRYSNFTVLRLSFVTATNSRAPDFSGVY
ncbi:hypothetical protein QQF64_018212 [Cirrhinus molitorella]|uniref:Uncharacterized protein n=1 Tax=Cirrhinus molitorella TaxID=172907 RepID=A0ABR3LKU4_9TELE